MSEFLKVPPPFEGPYWISLQKAGLPPSIIVDGEICEVIGMENDWSKRKDRPDFTPPEPIVYLRLKDSRLVKASETQRCDEKELIRKIKIDKILEQKLK